MKNQYLITLFLASILLLNGCGDDPFSVVLDVDPPEHVKQLAVHCYVTDKQTTLFAGLSESRALLDVNEELGNVPDGTISLYNEGTKLFDFESTNVSNWYINHSYDNTTPFGVKDGVMELLANAPGYPELRATQTFPDFVPITDLKFEKEGTIDIDGFKLDAVEITFDDPAGVENFYEIGLVAVDSSCINGEIYINRVYFETQNLNAERSGDYDGVLLSDIGFDGSEYKIVLGIYGNFDEDRNLSVVWKCISKDHYEYSRSLRAFTDNQDLGGFAQPISIFSNVENGLGIFTCAREEIYTALSASTENDPNNLTGIIDGTPYEPCDIDSYDNGGTGANKFRINSNDGVKTLSFGLSDIVVGEIGPDTGTTFYVYFYDSFNDKNYFYEEGVLEITSHDDDLNFVTGTFNGVLRNSNGVNDEIEVEDVIFEVTYSD